MNRGLRLEQLVFDNHRMTGCRLGASVERTAEHGHTENSQHDLQGLGRGSLWGAPSDSCCHVIVAGRRLEERLVTLAAVHQQQEAAEYRGEGKHPLMAEGIEIGVTWALRIDCGSVGAEGLPGHLDLGHDRGRDHEHAGSHERH